MPKWFTVFSQVLMTAGQGLNLWGGFIPVRAQGWVAVALGTAQAFQASVAHHYNPDGTSASVAYVPPAK